MSPRGDQGWLVSCPIIVWWSEYPHLSLEWSILWLILLLSLFRYLSVIRIPFLPQLLVIFFCECVSSDLMMTHDDEDKTVMISLRKIFLEKKFTVRLIFQSNHQERPTLSLSLSFSQKSKSGIWKCIICVIVTLLFLWSFFRYLTDWWSLLEVCILSSYWSSPTGDQSDVWREHESPCMT